jgi:hypothetical protein
MTLGAYAGLFDEDLENLADRLEDLHNAYDVADLRGTETAHALPKKHKAVEQGF